VQPILDGTKRQTIRADRRRHARPGEELQLFTGMRTKHCKLIAQRTCKDVLPIRLVFDDAAGGEGVLLPGFGIPGGLEGFARSDGFSSWAEMKAFWRKHHPGVDEFEGVLITWDVARAALQDRGPSDRDGG